MIGIIFATGFEARPFLELVRAELRHKTPFRIYTAPMASPMPIILSGIGKVAAAVACHVLIREYKVDYILNAGACGALHDTPELSLCNLVRISTAVEGDHTLFEKHLAPFGSAGRLDPSLPSVRLATSDKPVFDAQAKRYFSRLGDVVDMEGAAIARTAAYYNVPWDMLKGVSDAADDIDRHTLKYNLDLVSEKIARALADELP